MDLDKLNIQGMLDKFKQTKEGLDRTFRDIFAAEERTEDPKAKAEDAAAEDEPVIPEEAEAAPLSAEAEEVIYSAEPESTDSNIAEPEAVLPDLAVIEEKLNTLEYQLDKIDEAIGTLKTDSSNETARVIRIVENVSGKANRIGEKLTDLTNSLASVSKLNDSIFDLKNSQMNTKNSLGDLQSAFFRLKKKMTMGVTIISILTAVIAVLEVLNLLS